MAEITQYEQGIIILAGVTGSGKSTTIASMLQYINERERMHIVTIEDPIEFTFTDDKSIINQREVGIDVMDWHKALKDAVRQDPDIILVGEMRDQRHLQRGHARGRDRAPRVRHDPRLDAPRRRSAESSTSSPATCTRRCGRSWRSTSRRSSPRSCCRRPRSWPPRGSARVPTNEIMRTNPTVRKLILNEEDNKLGDAIRIGKEEGMQDFTESLRQLVMAEKIERATAFEVAPNVEQLENGPQGDYDRPTWYSVSRSAPTASAGRPGAAGRPRATDRLAGSARVLRRRKVIDDPSAPRPRDVRPADPRRRRRGRRRRARRPRCSRSRPPILRGPGFYLNLFKFVPVAAHLPALGLDDRLGRRRRQGAEQPPVRALELVIFFTGVLGFALRLGDPDLPDRPDPAAPAAYFVPLFTYIYVRNQTVPDDAKVLTPYHLGEVTNGLLRKMGMQADLQPGRDSGVDRAGPPIIFVGKSQGSAKDDPTRVRAGRGVAVVHVGQGAGLRRRAPARDRHPPRADHRAALGPLPDRRHPPRRRAVRPARPATP